MGRYFSPAEAITALRQLVGNDFNSGGGKAPLKEFFVDEGCTLQLGKVIKAGTLDGFLSPAH
jgi:hypothetical protein